MDQRRDENEGDFCTLVVMVSFGGEAPFRLEGKMRKSPTKSVKLFSGDVLVVAGASRLNVHGVDRIYPGASNLLCRVTHR